MSNTQSYLIIKNCLINYLFKTKITLNLKYIISATSTGDKNGLENGEGGLCQTKNMRLKIRVESKWTGVSQKSKYFQYIQIKSVKIFTSFIFLKFTAKII